MKKKQFLILIFVFAIAGCSLFSKQDPAPVRDLGNFVIVTKGTHVVQPGESLYAIAFQYGRDYRDIALVNQITSPYVIYPGQKLSLNEPSAELRAKGQKGKTKSTSSATMPTMPAISNKWIWPYKGNIIKPFTAKGVGLRGIDIAGKLGSNIQAANTGKVVYSGAGLRGYGLLIIIKHDDSYLSAYGHNSKLLVKEGDIVKQGQVIAYMGRTDTDKVKLHFEIRKNGQPINPVVLLPVA